MMTGEKAMSEPTVLFVDNHVDFLDTRAEFLEQAGYRVLKAYTLGQAKQQLLNSYFHVAVVDIRMEDDDNPNDLSGLRLCEDLARESVPVVLLTEFPGLDSMGRALRPNPDGSRLAVDYVDKRDGPQALIQRLESAFQNEVRINWRLKIRWGWDENLRQPHNLVSLIDPDLLWEYLRDRAEELEDVLRKVFFNYRQLTIGRIIVRRRGKLFLKAVAHTSQGREEWFVLLCGERHEVENERNRYDDFISGEVGSRSAVVVSYEKARHFAAVLYRLPNCATIEDVVPFVQFYQEQPANRVAVVVRDLLTASLGRRHKDGMERRHVSIHKLYHEWIGKALNTPSSRSEWEVRLDSVCQGALSAGIKELECTSHGLDLRTATREVFSYPSPLTCLSTSSLNSKCSVLYGIIQGNLDGKNVLVDDAALTWVLDFGHMSKAPLVRDFVSLETAVKFSMLRCKNLTLYHDLERRLLAQHDLGEAVNAEGLAPDAEKALTVIGEIRSCAADALGPEMNVYLIGLLLQMLKYVLDYQPREALRYTRGEMFIFAYALLSSGMICRRLTVPSERLKHLPPRAATSLWLDESEKQVWVEGRPVTLTTREFKFLAYLYQRANESCERSAIAEHLSRTGQPDLHPSQVKELDRDLLNSLVRRLRKKIEPNPSHPKYIVTVRGIGYRLVLDEAPVDIDSHT